MIFRYTNVIDENTNIYSSSILKSSIFVYPQNIIPLYNQWACGMFYKGTNTVFYNIANAICMCFNDENKQKYKKIKNICFLMICDYLSK